MRLPASMPSLFVVALSISGCSGSDMPKVTTPTTPINSPVLPPSSKDKPQLPLFSDEAKGNFIYFTNLSRELTSSVNALGRFKTVIVQEGRVLAGSGFIDGTLPHCEIGSSSEGFINPGDSLLVVGAKDVERFSEVRVDFSLQKMVGVSCWPAEGLFAYTTLEDVRKSFGSLVEIVQKDQN